jgi:hypothetical protein
VQQESAKAKNHQRKWNREIQEIARHVTLALTLDPAAQTTCCSNEPQETFEKNFSRKFRASSFWITLITGAL